MTWLDSVETKSLKICAVDGTPLWEIGVSPNTQGERARLTIQTIGNIPAEVMFDCVGFTKPGIVFQLMGMGPIRPDGRQRLAMSLNKDSAGGLSANIDSTVTGGSTCDPVPMLFAMGEDMYIGMYPDHSVYLAEDKLTDGKKQRYDVRIPISDLIRMLRRK